LITKVAKFATFQSSQIADLAGQGMSDTARIRTEFAIFFILCCHQLFYY